MLTVVPASTLKAGLSLQSPNQPPAKTCKTPVKEGKKKPQSTFHQELAALVGRRSAAPMSPWQGNPSKRDRLSASKTV